MSAVAIVRGLLLAAPDVTTTVPADRIRAGFVDSATPLPLIHLRAISDREGGEIGGPVEQVERVQCSVRVADYPQLPKLIKLVRAALRNQFGDVLQWHVSGVAVDELGPELSEAGYHERSIDFIVSYTGE